MVNKGSTTTFFFLSILLFFFWSTVETPKCSLIHTLTYSHRVLKYHTEEDTYCKTVVLDFSAQKPRALVASKAPRGRYDFDKPENITDLYQQSKKKNKNKNKLKISII